MQFDDWALIPGPEKLDQPMMSFDCDEVAEYAIDAFADVVLSFPETRLEREGSWWDWRAVWREGQHFIRIELTLLDGESPIWGGSPFTAICPLEKLMEFWQHLLSEFASVWMHDDECAMHTPQSFLAEIQPP